MPRGDMYGIGLPWSEQGDVNGENHVRCQRKHSHAIFVPELPRRAAPLATQMPGCDWFITANRLLLTTNAVEMLFC